MTVPPILKSLNVERINIVEPDGRIRMALFNSENMAEALIDGQNPLPDHRKGIGEAGIVFYNNHQDECGGMGFSSHVSADGSYQSSLSITFDQFKQDQVVQIFSSEKNGKRQYGYRIFDRPNTNLLEVIKMFKIIKDPDVPQEEKDRILAEMSAGNKVRMFLGKNDQGQVGVTIYDSKGRERILLSVDESGESTFQILDEAGNPYQL